MTYKLKSEFFIKTLPIFFIRLIKRCIIDSDAIEAKPFKEEQYKELVVIQHKSNNKWFVLLHSGQNLTNT